MPSSAPTWYDLLDVEQTASADEIRAAWKAAVSDLDPTDRRFRTLSDAAAVLLDKDRRAAYDAELADLEARRSEADAGDEDAEAGDDGKAAGETTVEARAAEEPDDATEAKESVAADEEAKAEKPKASRRPLPYLPSWLLIVVAVITAAAVTSAVVSLVRGGGETTHIVTASNNNDSKSTLERNFGTAIQHHYSTLIEEQAAEALSAAKEAAPVILSYDFRHLAADQQKAHAYMTASNRKDYDDLFALVKQNAPSTKTIVTALPPLDAGIVDASQNRVRVLLVFDELTTNAKTSKPISYQVYATLTMVKQDGSWLVDHVQTKPGT